MTKLFTTKKVKKYFDILLKLNRNSCNWYKGWNKLNPNSIPCQHEVFIKRTISKWFTGKYFIIYKNSHKQFIYTSNICFSYGYTDGIRVCFINYNTMDTDIITLKYNDILSLEGEWCKDKSKHNALLELISLNNIPEKEYIFKAYDWSKHPKRVKKGTDPKYLITTTKSFIAKTEHEAYKLKRKFEEQSKEHKGQLMISELIEVKEYNSKS